MAERFVVARSPVTWRWCIHWLLSPAPYGTRAPAAPRAPATLPPPLPPSAWIHHIHFLHSEAPICADPAFLSRFPRFPERAF